TPPIAYRLSFIFPSIGRGFRVGRAARTQLGQSVSRSKCLRTNPDREDHAAGDQNRPYVVGQRCADDEAGNSGAEDEEVSDGVADGREHVVRSEENGERPGELFKLVPVTINPPTPGHEQSLGLTSAAAPMPAS